MNLGRKDLGILSIIYIKSKTNSNDNYVVEEIETGSNEHLSNLNRTLITIITQDFQKNRDRQKMQNRILLFFFFQKGQLLATEKETIILLRTIFSERNVAEINTVS